MFYSWQASHGPSRCNGKGERQLQDSNEKNQFGVWLQTSSNLKRMNVDNHREVDHGKSRDIDQGKRYESWRLENAKETPMQVDGTASREEFDGGEMESKNQGITIFEIDHLRC